MTNEQIGEILFWALAATLLLVFLALFLGIRLRIAARVLGILFGIPVAIGVFSWMIKILPAETIGGWLTWGSLGGMCFGLLWVLTRGR